MNESFWDTTSGLITKVTALLTAITALILALRHVGPQPSPPPHLDSIPLHRYLITINDSTFYHLYSLKEISKVEKGNLKSEGIACYVYESPFKGSTEITSLWLKNHQPCDDNLLTSNRGEAISVRNHYPYIEDSKFYIYASFVKGTKPLYRLLLERNSTHFYTANSKEYESLIDSWKPEGTVGWVWWNDSLSSIDN
jgi:hypothetical protein